MTKSGKSTDSFTYLGRSYRFFAEIRHVLTRVLSPAVGAILMSASTIVVALNAQLLRRIDLDPAHLAPAESKEEHATPTPASTAVH